MSKLNPRGKSPARSGTTHEGATGVVSSAQEQLFELVVGCLYGKNNFYETTDEYVKRLKDAVDQCVQQSKGNPAKLDFIANTAIYARDEMNIRTMPVVLVVYFAEALRNNNIKYPNLRQLVSDVIQRADQLTDMYAFALAVFGDKKRVPMAIKRGVASAFNKFNEYSFAKYNSSNQALTMDRLLRIVHPKPSNATQGELFEKIMNDNLETPYTWETELSEIGQKVAEICREQGFEKESHEYESILENAKRQKWNELIHSGKLGYMALLRNLRNILLAKVDVESIDAVCKRLSDPEQVRKSKQLPFRFISAIEVLDDINPTQANNAHVKKLRDALDDALDTSFEFMPSLGENVWIILDTSASMNGGWGSSRQSAIKSASLLAAALVKSHRGSDNLAFTEFSTSASMIHLNPKDSITSLQDKIRRKVSGGGTNLHAALKLKGNLGFEPDTVIVLSDQQCQDCVRSASDAFGRDMTKLAFNFSAYETKVLNDFNGWKMLAGFSPAIFDFVPAMRERGSIVKILSCPYGTYKEAIASAAA